MSVNSNERRSLIDIGRSIRGYRDADGNVYVTGLTVPAVISQYRRARQESHGFCDFLITFMGIFFNSIFLTIGWVTGLIIPTCMILLGSMYLKDCPEERLIPLLLVVGGICIVVLYVLHMIRNCGNVGNIDERGSSCCCFSNLVFLFLVAWLIATSFYVYRIYKPNFDDIHCNRTLYTFSFWLLNIFYVVTAVMFLIMFCGICMYCIGD